MVTITAREPLETFADKIAARTGTTRQHVVHVLTSAMIVAAEQGRSGRAPSDGSPQREPGQSEASAGETAGELRELAAP